MCLGKMAEIIGCWNQYYENGSVDNLTAAQETTEQPESQDMILYLNQAT